MVASSNPNCIIQFRDNSETRNDGGTMSYWYNIGRISYHKYWQTPARQYWTNISYVRENDQFNYDI